MRAITILMASSRSCIIGSGWIASAKGRGKESGVRLLQRPRRVILRNTIHSLLHLLINSSTTAAVVEEAVAVAPATRTMARLRTSALTRAAITVKVGRWTSALSRRQRTTRSNIGVRMALDRAVRHLAVGLQRHSLPLSINLRGTRTRDAGSGVGVMPSGTSTSIRAGDEGSLRLVPVHVRPGTKF